jgi:hypothetical protein
VEGHQAGFCAGKILARSWRTAKRSSVEAIGNGKLRFFTIIGQERREC